MFHVISWVLLIAVAHDVWILTDKLERLRCEFHGGYSTTETYLGIIKAAGPCLGEIQKPK